MNLNPFSAIGYQRQVVTAWMDFEIILFMWFAAAYIAKGEPASNFEADKKTILGPSKTLRLLTVYLSVNYLGMLVTSVFLGNQGGGIVGAVILLFIGLVILSRFISMICYEFDWERGLVRHWAVILGRIQVLPIADILHLEIMKNCPGAITGDKTKYLYGFIVTKSGRRLPMTVIQFDQQIFPRQMQMLADRANVPLVHVG